MRLFTAIGTLFMTLSALLIWINAPISGGANPCVSFGWLAILIGVIAGIGWFRPSSRLLAVCAVAGLGLCSFSLVYLALRDPAFWSLVDENAQYASILGFSRRSLPTNGGIEPFFQIDLPTETVIDRLATAFYFVGWGWWVCLTGGFLILLPCLKADGKRNFRWAAIAISVMMASQGAVLLNGFAAQYLQEQGDRALARGRYVEAIEKYKTAQRNDPQLSWTEKTYLHLGDAYYQLGIPSHPTAHFYLGDRYSQEMNAQAALAEYLLAAQEASTPLRQIISKRIAWTYVTMGLVSQRKNDNGAAIGWWEIALDFDPAQLQATYFLVRSYFDEGRYERSIGMGNFLLRHSQNHLLNANVQANLGDAYWNLNDFSNARTAYEASMLLDSFANFRIFKSLGGT